MVDQGLRKRFDSINAASSSIPYGVLGAILFSTLFLTRFGLSSKGSHSELALVLVVMLLGVLVLAITGLIQLSLRRVMLYSVAMSAMVLATMLGSSGQVSPLSLLNLIALYFCYLFVVPSDETFGKMIRLFRLFMVIIASCGIVQFVAQLAVPGPTLFTFIDLFPDPILTHGFNFVIPVPGLERLNKANGFFLLEPSSLSQMTTLAIIVELEFFRPSWRLALFGVALLLSFSGTGLIMFGLVVPWLLIAKGRGSVLLIALPVLVLAGFAAAALDLTTAFDRLGEFSSEQSSGFARFLSPFYLFHDYIFKSMDTALFGLGPGSIEWFHNHAPYEIHDPTWGKVLFEYGVVGTIPFAVFVLYCFFAGARSYWLSAALFINYLILGGNLLDPRVSALILVLSVFQNRPGNAQALRLPNWRGPPRAGAQAAHAAAMAVHPLERMRGNAVRRRPSDRRIGVPEHPEPPRLGRLRA